MSEFDPVFDSVNPVTLCVNWQHGFIRVHCRRIDDLVHKHIGALHDICGPMKVDSNKVVMLAANVPKRAAGFYIRG